MQKPALLEKGYRFLFWKIERHWANSNSRFAIETYGFPLEREERIRKIVEGLLGEVLGTRKWENLTEEEKREVAKGFLRKVISFHLRPEAWYDKTFQSHKWYKAHDLGDFILLIDEEEIATMTLPYVFHLGYDKKRKKPVLLMKVEKKP